MTDQPGDASFAVVQKLECPECSTPFEARTWVVIDLERRPDLAQLLEDGELHQITCPHCHQVLGHAEATTLIYRSTVSPRLLIAPARMADRRQTEFEVRALVSKLASALDSGSQEDLADEPVQVIPHALVSAVLRDGFESAIAETRRLEEAERQPRREIEALTGAAREQRIIRAIADGEPLSLNQAEVTDSLLVALSTAAATEPPGSDVAKTLSRAVEHLRSFQRSDAQVPLGDLPLGRAVVALLQANSIAAARAQIEAVPGLLSMEAAHVLAQIGAVQRTPEARASIDQLRSLLARCGQVGIEQAFTELTRAEIARLQLTGAPSMPVALADNLEQVRSAVDGVSHDPTRADAAIALLTEVLPRVDVRLFPTLAGSLLNDLGNMYWAKPNGDSGANLSAAAASFRRAIDLFARKPDEKLVTTSSNLAQVHLQLFRMRGGDHLILATSCLKRALGHCAQEAAPLPYATLRFVMGGAALERQSAAGIEEAITHYQSALPIFRRENDLGALRSCLSALGAAYRRLPTGDLEQHRKHALEAYSEALELCDRDTAPFDYAQIQTSLGILYATEHASVGLSGLEAAEAAFRAALEIETPETVPERYANTQNALGDAIRRLAGGRQERVREAIDCFKESLRYRSRELQPRKYASTLANLALALADSRERVADLRRADELFGEAYELLSSTDIHGAAHVLSSHANLLSQAPFGERSINTQRAIELHHRAVALQQSIGDLVGVSMSHNNLGTTYLRSTFGEPQESLERAVEHFEAALELVTPASAPALFAMLKNNLGNAHIELSAHAARRPHLLRAVACITEGLRYRTRDRMPTQFAIGMNALGLALSKLERDPAAARGHFREAVEVAREQGSGALCGAALVNLGNAAATPDEAVAAYQDALAILTLEGFPAERAKALHALGQTLFNEARWEEAAKHWASCIDAQAALYGRATSEISRTSELAAAPHPYAERAYCLARLERFDEALECLEAGRARVLNDALADEDLWRTDVDRAAVDAQRLLINRLEQRARGLGFAESPQESAAEFQGLSRRLQSERAQLRALLMSCEDHPTAALDVATLGASIPAGHALVYLVTTSHGTLAFFVESGSRTVSENDVLWADAFRAAELNALLFGPGPEGGGLLSGHVGDDVVVLQRALDRALEMFGEHVMTPVLDRLAESDIHKVALVPCGHLAFLSVGACSYRRRHGEQVIDHAEVVVALSGRIQAVCRRRSQHPLDGDARFLGVIEPGHEGTAELRFAAAEVRSAARHFVGRSQILEGHAATLESCIAGLARASYVHFSVHATFSPRRPLDSALLLAGTERLALRDLLDVPLSSGCRVGVLSGCRTGLVKLRSTPDEVIGLPAGFIRAGFSAVLCALWPVSDLATTLLVSRLYAFHETHSLAEALRRAQLWLRDARSEELFESLEEITTLSGEERTIITSGLRPGERPFRHPYYWGGLVVVGSSAPAGRARE